MNFFSLIRVSILPILSIIFSITSAQTISPCGTDDVRKQILGLNPEIEEREADFNKFASEFGQNGNNQRSAPYIIPVVFHIIHDYGAENISDEQVYDAIEKINQDFSKTNSDFFETVPEFQGVAADCQIEFRLAQRTLSGGCTNGIERIPSLRTYEGSDAAKLSGWQSAFYLNIWVVKDLQNGAAAYAYYPTSIGGMLIPVDGIICRYDYVGSIGAAGAYSAHTLSHEIGHYLNLAHCWGNTNSPGVACGDDQVPDTPVTEGWVSCYLSGATCDNEIDNVQNIMEYSYCSTMFTEGQKTRMFAALNSEDALRNNLWIDETLELTGTIDGYEAGLCAPEADFYSDSRFLCVGQTANFHDVSWGGNADSRSWEFEGGIPATSTDVNPLVTFAEPGWHKVSITTTNATGTSTKFVDEYIYISTEFPVYNESYFGNFNEENEVMSDWVFYNKYPDDHFWQWKGTNGYWAGGCAWLNSRFVPDDETDAIISPSFDLSSGSASNVFFKYSTTTYAVYEDDYDMALKLYFSTNCGKTWTNIGQITGDDWEFTYGGGTDFAPTMPEQWAPAIFNLPTGAQHQNVKFKIEFVANRYSNNVFIDDFNFTTWAMDIPDEEQLSGFTISPNPSGSDQTVQISYNLLSAGEVMINIIDLTGRVVASLPQGNLQTGLQTLNFTPGSLQIGTGCYFITVESDMQQVNRKLVVF